MIEGKRFFITGGLGFIASHLTEALMESNKVVLFDNGHRRSLATWACHFSSFGRMCASMKAMSLCRSSCTVGL